MRTQLEAPPAPYTGLEELEQRFRHLSADLVAALRSVPTVDEVPARDRELVKDIHFTIAEAHRLAVDYRRRIHDRLACATPGQSQHTSPPDPSAHAPPSRPAPT